MNQDEDNTIEKRLDNVATTVEEFKDAASILGDDLLTEKKWRRWFVGIALVLGVGLVIIGFLLVLFISELQNVADRAADQSVSNFNAIQSNQDVLDQIQECNDPLSECAAKRDALIRGAQEGIKVDTHEQMKKLREEFQNLLSQLQRGETISQVSKSLTDNNESPVTTISYKTNDKGAT